MFRAPADLKPCSLLCCSMAHNVLTASPVCVQELVIGTAQKGAAEEDACQATTGADKQPKEGALHASSGSLQECSAQEALDRTSLSQQVGSLTQLLNRTEYCTAAQGQPACQQAGCAHSSSCCWGTQLWVYAELTEAHGMLEPVQATPL